MRATGANGLLFRGLLGVVLLLGLVPNNAQGAISACAGASLATLAGATGNTPTGGCGTVDIGFNGFMVSSGSVGLGAINLATMTGGAVSGTGAGQLITPIVATFLSNGWATTTGNSTVTYSAFDTHLQVVPGESAPASPYVTWGITDLALSLSQAVATPPANSALNYVEVKSEFCLGSAAFNCLTTAANYGYMTQRLTYNPGASTVIVLNTICSPGAGGCTALTNASTSAAVNFGTNYYLDIGIRSSVTVNHLSNANGTTIALNSFSMTVGQLAETPEPSTWSMGVVSVIGFWLMRRGVKREVSKI